MHPLYRRALSLLAGETTLPESQRRFLDRLQQDFGIQGLLVGVDTTSLRPAGRQVLEIAVPGVADVTRHRARPDREKIAALFIDILRQTPDASLPGVQELTALQVGFHSMEESAAQAAIHRIKNESLGIPSLLTPAYEGRGLSGIDELNDLHFVIRWDTPARATSNAATGVNTQLRDDLLKLLKAHDPGGWITAESLTLEFISDEEATQDFYR